MTAPAQPHREPFRDTLIRNMVIALAVATGLAFWSPRTAYPIHWPVAVVLMLWPTFGGHYLEVWYLNWLTPKLPASANVRRLARLVTWFCGGCVLGVAMMLTVRALSDARPAHWPAWWLPGVIFVGLELVVHSALLLRGQRNFFSEQAA
jgi:hypothetical protein